MTEKYAVRRIGLCLAVAALACSLVGTGGFASATADRGIATETTDDSQAFVGYESPDDVRIEFNESREANGSDPNATRTVAVVTVTNRLDASVGVASVDVDPPGGLDVAVVSTPGTLDPGESGAIAAELSCERSFESGELSVGFEVDGGRVRAELSGDEPGRTVSVTCDGDA
jgi:hypothetical protein